MFTRAVRGCRYFLRTTVTKSLANIVRERDLWVVGVQSPPPVISPYVFCCFALPQRVCFFDSTCLVTLVATRIKLEVGIEHALHIEFEYQRAVFEVHDVIIGRVYFGLVRVRLTHAEIAIVCRETVGYVRVYLNRACRSLMTKYMGALGRVGTASVINDATSAATWEIMDGAPAKGRRPLSLLWRLVFQCTRQFVIKA